MGTTLQNGVYLPNEGERNCYAGLKTNWEILDQKVADVTALQQAVAGALHREIVASLPITDIDPNTIYMILSGTSATENVYNEFMYVNNAWELIGTSATDLTNYYTKGDVDGLLVLKANASDLTSHTGDTTIHVTANDKSKWNTVALIKQLRLVNAQVGSATTIAFANIDDTNGIKVGDKCMDLDAKMFEITAVDTTNQTVTVGSALIDLAQDSDVVHKSGNETVGGAKTFTDNNMIKTSSPKVLLINTSQTGNTPPSSNAASFFRFDGGTVNNFGGVQCEFLTTGENRLTNYVNDITKAKVNTIQQRASSTTAMTVFNADLLVPANDGVTALGSSSKRWSDIYGVNYYYGSNNVEFSTKFVTTDTAQTISGNKTFGNGTLTVDNGTGSNVHGEIKFNGSRSGYIVADNASDGVFDNAECGISVLLQDSGKPLHIGGYKVDANGRVFVDNTNKKPVLSIKSGLIQTTTLVPENDSTGALFRILSRLDYANGDASKVLDIRFQQNDDADATSVIYSYVNNKTSLGTASKKWKDFQTYLINGLTPSSLGMPVAPSSTSYVDISGYITVLDGSTPNTYTPPSNGYITFNVTGNLVQIFHDYGLQGKWSTQAGNANRGFIPVLGGVEVKIYITASNVDKFWFIPCQGNI